jgi:hypothetical protein
MSKAKASKTKRTAKPNRPKSHAAKPKPALSPDCPYRGMYGVLFSEGSKDYVAKDELLARVSKMTGKSVKSTSPKPK